MDTGSNPKKSTWDWRTRKPNNMLVIEAGPTTGFFKWWCIWNKPVIDLTSREIDVVASLLKQRWELTKIISDPAIVDSQLMSDDTRTKVTQECGITRQHLYVLMGSLKRKGVITDTGINPKLVPNIRQTDNGIFQFLLLFKDSSSNGV